MRSVVACGLVLAHLVGCGQPTSPTEPCEGGACDYARDVVIASQPLTLTNTRTESVTWPIWGSAFSADGVVRARVRLEADGDAGLVFADAGDPEERRSFGLTRKGATWELTENAGDVPRQATEIAGPAAGEWIIEIADGGRTLRASNEGATAMLTSQTADGPMGIYVRLAPGAKLDILDLAITQPLPPASLTTPLQALARMRGRAMGSTSETGEWPPRHDLHFEAMYATEFEVAGILDFYWTTTRGEDRDFDFLPADLMVNYATVHEQKIDGYFLVWDEELPEWIYEYADTQGDVGALLDEHIETTMRRYQGRVASWIVVNEAFLGPDENGTSSANYAESIWYEFLDADYIARAFRVADEIDPSATLIYNETGAEAEGPKSNFMFARISELVNDGVPIDAVGLQFHVDAASPPDMASVKRNMQRFAALGLDILITELDVSLSNFPGTHAARLARQAELFSAVVDTCLEVPACKTITTFGFSDKHGWDELGPAVCNTEGDRELCSEPLLLTREYEPKPAYDAVRSTLAPE